MTDCLIRVTGRAGHITLNRPKALNALTYRMCLDIEDALLDWRNDDAVDLILLDATGDKAFCAGGDIAEMYATGTADDYAYGQKFWRDEYRLNALIAEYPKPVVSFLQGFTMGGGVGVGCHGSHRIVGDTSQIAMPECGIGLIPDVGGSLILTQAPGWLGVYLGITADRMNAADALYAGFADQYVPEAKWDALKTTLADTGTIACLSSSEIPAPGPLQTAQAEIDALFAGMTLRDILNSLRRADSDFAKHALGKIERNSPLAMASCMEILNRLRAAHAPTIRTALELEYRFTSRSMEHGDFIEGIRAAIIDKDRSPRWTHELDAVPAVDVSAMLRPVTGEKLNFEREGTEP